MLILSSEEDEKIAIEHLEECKQTIIDPVLKNKTLKVDVVGVDIMNTKPSAANVLFGKAVSDELQIIANKMAYSFANRFNVQPEHNEVKLHVTLINTRKSKKQRSFDATKILENYRNFNFGSLTVDEIHISHLLATDTNGYYQPRSALKL